MPVSAFKNAPQEHSLTDPNAPAVNLHVPPAYHQLPFVLHVWGAHSYMDPHVSLNVLMDYTGMGQIV